MQERGYRKARSGGLATVWIIGRGLAARMNIEGLQDFKVNCCERPRKEIDQGGFAS